MARWCLGSSLEDSLKDDLQFDDSEQDPFEQTPLPFSENRRVPVSTPEPGADSAPASRCDSCGGSIDAGKLCPRCEQAFHGVLEPDDAQKNLHTIPTSDFEELFAALEEAQARSKQPTATEMPAAAEPVPQTQTMTPAEYAHWQTDAPAPMPEPAISLNDVAKFEPFISQSAFDQPEPKPIALKPEPAAMAIEHPVAIPDPAAAQRQPAVAALPNILEETHAPIALPELLAAAEASATVTPSATVETKDAVSAKTRLAVSGGLKRFATAAAAILVVAAIGVPLTKLWLGRRQTIVASNPVPAAKPAAKPAPAAKAPQRANTGAVAPAINPTAARTEAPAPAPARAAVVAAPKPAATVQPRAVEAYVKPAPRPAAKPVRPVKPASVPALGTAAPVLESAIALPDGTEVTPVAPPPTAVAQDAPIAPFYEPTQVDKTPQVLSRAEPEMSPELQSRANGEIVVVRFLVTQTGRPVLVSLLRPSKAGLALDEAVIAAIKKWTFAPAIKRGHAVSCFVHLGVPIGR
jgi:TonB family protein